MEVKDKIEHPVSVKGKCKRILSSICYISSYIMVFISFLVLFSEQ
jgi:hypothetical protein